MHYGRCASGVYGQLSPGRRGTRLDQLPSIEENNNKIIINKQTIRVCACGVDSSWLAGVHRAWSVTLFPGTTFLQYKRAGYLRTRGAGVACVVVRGQFLSD